MRYKINWLEEKTTSTGKKKYDLTLDKEDGTQEDKVTMWADFPDFANMKPGTEIEGDVVVKVNGQYTNKTIYPIKPKVAPTGQTGGFKGNMVATMAKKQEGIEKSQSRKEDSIQISSTARDATILTTAELNGKTEQEIKDIWTKWRKWLLNNWDVDERELKAPF